MNNFELAAKCLDIAKNYKTLYVLGGFGQPLTDYNKQRMIKLYPYNAKRSGLINAATKDTFAWDCVGLIKGIMWGWSASSTDANGGARYQSNGVPDIGADTMIRACANVSTDFSNIQIGEVVWKEGHIGVYIGNGLAAESSPAWADKVQITAVGNIGTKTGYNTRWWTKHGKLPYIKYCPLGDLNFDGKVTAADSRLALRAAVGLEKLTPAQMLAGDVDGDGKITAADHRKILRWSVGLK